MVVESREVFAREATGLVRSFNWFDAFVISSASCSPALWTYASQIVYIASADPGADILISTALGFLFSVPLAIVYYFLSTLMPRSGGDYVWTSRFINSSVGFMAAFAFWIANVGVVGIISYLEGTVFVPISLASFGYELSNPSLLNLASAMSQSSNILIVGLLNLVVASVIAFFGPKIFSRVMAVMFVLVYISTIISFFVLATSSHTNFVNTINGYGGLNITYDSILNTARVGGWAFVHVQWATTFVSIPLSVLLFAGFNYSAGAAGEMKNVNRSMFFGIVFALFFAFAVNAIGVLLSLNVVGYEFTQAALALGPNWPLAASPWMPLFISMLTHHNLVLLILIHVGWLVTLPWNAAGILLVVTRYVFAFSYDRAFPVGLSTISDKFHSPIYALILNFVVATIFVVLSIYTSFIGLFLNAVAIDTIMWALGSAVAIVLPFKKRDLMKSLPGGNWKVPSLTIVGCLSLVLMLTSFFFNVTTPAIGPSTPQADAFLATIFITGLAIYLVRYYYLKGQGIDLRLIYSQIPPE